MAAGESSTVATFGVTVHCVRMALKCSAFLQRAKVLFPARGPVFSSPVWAPHNWGLCSLWSFSLLSVFAGRLQQRCCVWDDMNSSGFTGPCYHGVAVLLRPSVVWWLEVFVLTLCLIQQCFFLGFLHQKMLSRKRRSFLLWGRGSAALWNCWTVAALSGLPRVKRWFCVVIINLSTTLWVYTVLDGTRHDPQ